LTWRQRWAGAGDEAAGTERGVPRVALNLQIRQLWPFRQLWRQRFVNFGNNSSTLATIRQLWQRFVNFGIDFGQARAMKLLAMNEAFHAWRSLVASDRRRRVRVHAKLD